MSIPLDQGNHIAKDPSTSDHAERPAVQKSERLDFGVAALMGDLPQLKSNPNLAASSRVQDFALTERGVVLAENTRGPSGMDTRAPIASLQSPFDQNYSGAQIDDAVASGKISNFRLNGGKTLTDLSKEAMQALGTDGASAAAGRFKQALKGVAEYIERVTPQVDGHPDTRQLDYFQIRLNQAMQEQQPLKRESSNNNAHVEFSTKQDGHIEVNLKPFSDYTRNQADPEQRQTAESIQTENAKANFLKIFPGILGNMQRFRPESQRELQQLGLQLLSGDVKGVAVACANYPGQEMVSDAMAIIRRGFGTDSSQLRLMELPRGHEDTSLYGFRLGKEALAYDSEGKAYIAQYANTDSLEASKITEAKPAEVARMQSQILTVARNRMLQVH